MECEHDNSARCELPPLNNTRYWSEPEENVLWVCDKCKQMSDVYPPLFRVCRSCYYKKCHGCFYGVENTWAANKAAAEKAAADKEAANKAAADKAAADKAAAIVIDLSEVVSTYVHYL